MKKIFIIMILSVLATLSLYAVHDNTGATGKTGTGSFGATIINPIGGGIIGGTADHELGEFVVSTTKYTTALGYDLGDKFMTFSITGDANNHFFFRITQYLGTSTSNAQIELKWYAGNSAPEPEITDMTGDIYISDGYLSADTGGGIGEFNIVVEVISVKANFPGAMTFEQKAEWQYNSF
jgi:hypothetical protein